MILVVCIKSNLIVTYIVSFAAGVGVAAAFLLPWLDPCWLFFYHIYIFLSRTTNRDS